MKPLASLSLDLDNEWSYLKTHGDVSWEALPSYLDVAVPRALELLRSLDLTITFFVVGQDAALERNHDAIAALSRAGHEIGNHSFSHEPWMHKYSEAQVADELSRTEEALSALTGMIPVGFRGPGYSLSPTVLRVLSERGYLYDASTLPTVVGPLARAFYFRSSRLDAKQREERSDLFGSAAEALRPLSPYRWDVGADGIVEIRVPRVVSAVPRGALTRGRSVVLPHGFAHVQGRPRRTLDPAAPARSPWWRRRFVAVVLPGHGHERQGEARARVRLPRALRGALRDLHGR